VRDTPALVDRLASLTDASTRAVMGAIARETVEARFSEGAMVDRYERLLTEVESAG
jgi:glycosyltransferase involved in cell wall biosynthesis